MISSATQDTIKSLRLSGIRFTIMTEVGHRVELHNEVKRENGKEEIQFVAEIDGYGNITECGPILKNGIPTKDSKIVLNADGEKV